MATSSLNADTMRPILRCYLEEQWQRVYENGRGAIIVSNLGKTACFVEPTDAKDGRTRVNVRSPIVAGVPRSPAFFELIALNATNWTFGALSTYEEDDLNVEFDLAILADGLTSAALNYYVREISSTADSLATMFHDQFGVASCTDINGATLRAAHIARPDPAISPPGRNPVNCLSRGSSPSHLRH